MVDICKLSRGLASLITLILLFSTVFSTALSISAELVHASLYIQSAPLAANSSLNQGLVGWWTFDSKDMKNNVADKSGPPAGGGNNGYMIGFTSTSSATTEGKLGQGLRFDGVDDYVNVKNIDFLESGDMTFCLWIYPQRISGVQWLLKQWESGGRGPALFLDGSEINWEIGSYSTGRVQTTGVVTANQWQHTCATADDSVLTIYHNSVSKVSNSVTRTESEADEVFTINNVTEGGLMPFQGRYDDVRIYNRALSPAEIKQLYSMGGSKLNATAPNNPSLGLNTGLVGYWTFDSKDMKNNVADKSGNGNNGRLLGFTSTSSSITEGKLGQGLTFDNTNDCVSFNSASSLNDLSSFTYSSWIYAKSNGADANGGSIISKGFKKFFYITSLNRLSTFIDTDGVDMSVTSLSGTLPFNVWTHVVVTWDGTVGAGSLKQYKNGDFLNASTGGTGNVVSDSASTLTIGGVCSSRTFDGTLDDVRVYNRALSPAEIKQLYNLGQSKFNATSPNNPSFGLNSGLVGYWTFDSKDMKNNVADKSGMGNNGRLVGFTSTSSAVTEGKMGQGLKFNGVNEYVSMGNGVALRDLPNGSFSVSAWIKTAGDGSGDVIIKGTGGNVGWRIRIDEFRRLQFYIERATTDLGVITSLNTLPGSELWKHITVVYPGGDAASNVRVFANGSEITSFLTQTDGVGAYQSDSSTEGRLMRGAFSGGYVLGLLDDVRIYNRALSAAEVRQLYNMGR